MYNTFVKPIETIVSNVFVLLYNSSQLFTLFRFLAPVYRRYRYQYHNKNQKQDASNYLIQIASQGYGQ